MALFLLFGTSMGTRMMMVGLLLAFASIASASGVELPKGRPWAVKEFHSRDQNFKNGLYHIFGYDGLVGGHGIATQLMRSVYPRIKNTHFHNGTFKPHIEGIQVVKVHEDERGVATMTLDIPIVQVNRYEFQRIIGQPHIERVELRSDPFTGRGSLDQLREMVNGTAGSVDGVTRIY